MSTNTVAGKPMPAIAAAVIASSAFTVPLAMSLSSTRSPNHPQTMLWFLLLRKPGFKPPDWIFPVAWTAIEGALAVSGFRLLRAPADARRNKSLALWGWNVCGDSTGGVGRICHCLDGNDLGNEFPPALASMGKQNVPLVRNDP